MVIKNISIFDIVGPSMVGPSSSHTAGAVRLGLFAGKIFGSIPQKVKFTLYNSFAKTGKGHGTDKGLIGGIIGLGVNDPKIKNSYSLADKLGIEYEFAFEISPVRHPNSVDIEMHGDMDIVVSGNSIGGGEIQVINIDGFSVNLQGNLPALLLMYKDQPGMIWMVTKHIQESQVNIATLSCERMEKGQTAFMSICLDSVLPVGVTDAISNIPGMYVVRSVAALEK